MINIFISEGHIKFFVFLSRVGQLAVINQLLIFAHTVTKIFFYSSGVSSIAEPKDMKVCKKLISLNKRASEADSLTDKFNLLRKKIRLTSRSNLFLKNNQFVKVPSLLEFSLFAVRKLRNSLLIKQSLSEIHPDLAKRL